MANLKYIGKNILNHDLELKKGNVSGSSTSTGSFGSLVVADKVQGALTVGGNLNVSQYIYHADDANTYLNFTNDRLRFNIGGISYIDLNDAGSAPHDITFNDGSNNVDFIIKGDTNNPLFKTDSSENRIGTHGKGTPEVAFHIGGSELRVDGNISGSSTGTGSFGTIQTTTGTIPTLLGDTTFNDNLTVTGNLDIADTIYHTGDSNTKIRFPEVDTIAFNTSGLERLRITSDGQISGSAVSTGSFGQLVIGNGGDIELSEDQRIYFESDKGTFIEANMSDSLRVVAGGSQMFVLDYDTGNRAVFGNGTKVYIGSDNNKQPDKELVVDGDISGSASSTGSFGSLISRTTYIGEYTPIFYEGANMLVVDSSDSQILSIRRGDGNNQWNFGLSVTGDLGFRERTNDAGSGTTHHTFYKAGYVKFGGHITGSENVKFGTTGTSISRYEFNKTAGGTTPFHFLGRDTSNATYPIATFDHNGGTSLWVGTTKISGSATSTGSFGHIETPGNLEVAGTGSFNVVSASIYLGQVGARHVHSQGAASSTWTVTHNLGLQHPNVTVYNSDNQIVIPQSVTADGGSSMTITFSEPVAGSATLSTGGASSSNTGRTFSFNQSSVSPIWRVTHSLGERYPAITVYDEASNVIIPERIHAVGTGNAEIYFQDATSGNAHFSVGNGLPGINPSNAGNFMRVNEDGTQIEYVASAISDVTGSLPITGSITLTGSLFATEDIEVQGNIRAVGDVIANRYVVSSSVTHLTQSLSSGSTIFGDTLDDTHQFTGSLSVTGSTAANFYGRLNFRPNVISNSEGAFWIDPSYANGSLSSARIYVNSNNQLVFSRAGNDNLFIGTGGSVSGSATTTGSFGRLSIGAGTVSNTTSGQVGVELGSKTKSGNNAFVIAQKDGDTRQTVFYARSGSNGGYETFLGSDDGYNFGYVRGWTGKLYMQDQHILSRNAGANAVLTFQGTGGINVPKITLTNQIISGSQSSLDFYMYGGGKFDMRSYYNETFKFRVNSGTAVSPEYVTRMIFGHRDGGGKIGLGGVTNPTEAVHIGAGSNLRNTGSFGDVRLYVDGNISGSAISTGSFGAINVDQGNGGVGNQSNTRFGRSAGLNWGTGTENTYIGNQAGRGASGNESYNTGLGSFALYAVTDGDSNVAVGVDVGTALTTGDDNMLIGRGAGNAITGTSDTVLIGRDAGGAINSTDANGTIAIGYEAGKAITSGQQNTALGYQALYTEDTGDFSTAIGYQALYTQNRDGTVGNTAVGHQAGMDITTGFENTLVGTFAGGNLTQGEENVMMGQSAGGTATTQASMTLIGFRAGLDINSDDADGTVLIGRSAGENITSGIGNVAVGAYALDAEDDGDFSTAIGYQALSAQTGVSGEVGNTAVGYQAGLALTAGTQNTVMGYHAGKSLLGGSTNTIIGSEAGKALNNGSSNTIVGRHAAYSLTTGDDNVAIGQFALSTITTQSDNVAVGRSALNYITGEDSVAVGYYAGLYATGSNNTFVGSQAGQGGTTSAPYSSGIYNTFIGANAGKVFTTGGYNTAVGYDAGVALTTGDGNVIMGTNSGTQIDAGGSNTAIGSDAQRYNNVSEVVVIGERAGLYNTGNKNVYVGNEAGRNSFAGTEGVFIGMNAGYYSTGSYNTFVGKDAGKGGTTSAPYSSGTQNVALGYGAFDSFTTGNYNVTVGVSAGGGLTVGNENVAIGQEALLSATGTLSTVVIGMQAGYNINSTDANRTVLIGYTAGRSLTSGQGNVAIGSEALRAEDDGDGNTAIGYQALVSQGGTSGTVGNTVVGMHAGGKITSGKENTFMGYRAGGRADAFGLTTGNYNTGIGFEAGGCAGSGANLTGDYNTSLGYKAGVTLQGDADENTLIGGRAAIQLTTGDQNTVVGSDAFYTATTTSEVVVIGKYAGYTINSTDANGTVAIGTYSLNKNTSGQYNTSVGYYAGEQNQVGDDNTFMGYHAGRYATGSQNTFVGSESGRSSDSAPYGSGGLNTGVGNSTLKALTTGYRNVAIGHRAGENVNTGYGNTYIGGYRTGYYNQTGHSNIGIGNSAIGADANNYVNELVAVGVAAGALTAGNVGDTDGNVYVGYNAGYSNISGSGLTFLGYKAGQNATGSLNTYIGYRSGQGTGGAAATTGKQNTGVGYETLKAITAGAYNTAIGKDAGKAITTANYNTFVGAWAGDAVTAGGYNTVLGFQAFSAASSDSNFTVAVGHQAGMAITSGDGNVILGSYAGLTTTDVDNAVLIGRSAGQSGNMTSAADGTIAIGYQAMKVHTTGARNIAIGYNAMSDTDAGSTSLGSGDNIFIGYSAGSGTWTDAATNGNVGIGSYALDAAMDGALYNTAVGAYAASAITSADNVVAIGNSAAYSLTTGANNVAIGTNAMKVHTTGERNMAIGTNAMDDTDAGSTSLGSADNIFMGHNAGSGTWADAASNYNVAIGNLSMDDALNGALGNTSLGYYTLSGINTGDYNVALGYQAGINVTTGGDNTFVGRDAGYQMRSGSNNVAVGTNAFYDSRGSSQNTVMGAYAGHNLEIATGQVHIGYKAGYANKTGTGPVAIGYEAMGGAAGTNEAHGIAIGYRAQYQVKDGSSGTAIGSSTLQYLVGQYSVAVGDQAGFYATGSYNTFVGRSAGEGGTTSAPYSSGEQNTAVGNEALQGLTTGDYNVAMGMRAAEAITTGGSNVAIGSYALDAATTLSNNTAVGFRAGGSHTTGESNVWVGKEAGEVGTYHVSCTAVGVGALNRLSGSYNTAIGESALSGNQGGGATNSNRNTAVGYYALNKVGQGGSSGNQENVGIGYQAGDVATTGTNNVFVGAHAGGTVTTGGALTMLGHGADPSGNTTSGEIVIGYNATGIGANYVVLGSGDITRVYMSQDGDAVMYADGTINTSDRRTKQNIEKLNIGLDFINKLNPVTYNKRQLSDYDDSLKEKLPWHIRGEEPAVLADEEISKSRVGFIAQDVGEALEELGFDSNNDIVEVDDKTEKQHLDYAKFVPALVKSVQELSSENKKLKNKLNDLEIFIMDKLGDDK